MADAPSVAQAVGGIPALGGDLALLFSGGSVPLPLSLLAVSMPGQLLVRASALLGTQVAVTVDATQVVADAHCVAGLLAERMQHSRKPDSLHDVAETMPGPRLELFARRARPGWTVWGNEVEANAK